MSRILLSLALAAGMTSCSVPQDSNSDLSIYGGHPSGPGNWPTAVSITKDDKAYCTGTLVHPKLVITAAHCVARWTGSESGTARMKVHIGNGSSTGTIKAQYKIVRSGVHPLYKNHRSGWSDTAYVVLDRPVENVAIVPIMTDLREIQQALTPGNKAIAVGFGYDESRVIGLKREVETSVRAINSNEIVLGGNGIDSCNGDSGGPLYSLLPSGEWRVFGIVSRGLTAADALGEADHGCGQGGAWGLMHDSICWIQKDSGIGIADSKIECNPSNVEYSEPEIQDFDLSVMASDPFSSKSQRYTIEALRVSMGVDDIEEILKKLKESKTLVLDNLDLTDVSPLASLEDLEYLSLKDNRLKVIGSLKRLKNLKVLDIGRNEIEDYSELKELEDNGLRILGKKLQQSNFLETEFLKICDAADYGTPLYNSIKAVRKHIAFGAYCERANSFLMMRNSLVMVGKEIGEISFLKGLQNLAKIDFSDNLIKDVSVMNSLEGVKKLALNDNQIETVDALGEMLDIEALSLTNNRLTDVSVLAKLKTLKKLDLTGNYITDFTAFKELEEAGLVITGKDEQKELPMPPATPEDLNPPAPPVPPTPPGPHPIPPFHSN